MDNKAILEEIAKQLTVLEKHISRLKNKPESLHDIDVEVMGEKVKEIYTLLNNLLPEEFEENLELKVRTAEVTKVPMVEVKPEPEIPEPKAPEMSSEVEEERVPSPEPQAPEPEDRTPSNEQQAPKIEERESKIEEQEVKIEVENKIVEEVSPQPPATSSEPPAPSPQPPAPESKDEPAKTTADLFSGPKTIADSFQAEEDNSIAATVNPQPTQDLKLAIGINDKFLFINELFQGDPSIYNRAIENMNAAGGLVQALSALDGYRAEYNWADKSEAYHRLKKIVNSKYNG